MLTGINQYRGPKHLSRRGSPVSSRPCLCPLSCLPHGRGILYPFPFKDEYMHVTDDILKLTRWLLAVAAWLLAVVLLAPDLVDPDRECR